MPIELREPRCRKCRHVEWLHARTYYYSCNNNNPELQADKCGCKEFVPEGNLEYLEWRYKKYVNK